MFTLKPTLYSAAFIHSRVCFSSFPGFSNNSFLRVAEQYLVCIYRLCFVFHPNNSGGM